MSVESELNEYDSKSSSIGEVFDSSVDKSPFDTGIKGTDFFDFDTGTFEEDDPEVEETFDTGFGAAFPTAFLTSPAFFATVTGAAGFLVVLVLAPILDINQAYKLCQTLIRK